MCMHDVSGNVAMPHAYVVRRVTYRCTNNSCCSICTELYSRVQAKACKPYVPDSYHCPTIHPECALVNHGKKGRISVVYHANLVN